MTTRPKMKLLLSLSLALLTGMTSLGVIALPAGAASTIAYAQGCGLAWRVIPSLNHGTIDNYLYAVDALSPSDVWVAGTDRIGNASRTLLLHWNGSQWAEVTGPNPSFSENYFFALASVAPNEVWAMGNYGSGSDSYVMLARWDGSAWTRITSPSVRVSLTAPYGDLAALSTNDVWAVGHQIVSGVARTLAMRWNGSAWSIVPTPNMGLADNYLTSVAAVAPDDVWASGSYLEGGVQRTLTMHWDGVAWSIVPSPNVGIGNNLLNGMAAVSAADVWSVGQHEEGVGITRTLALHWDNVQWSVTQTQHPEVSDVLNDVAATSANDVWAVGRQRTLDNRTLTLIQRWDGGQWSVVPSPNSATTFNDLQDVSAISQGDIWAVGSFRQGTSASRTLVLRYSDPCGGTVTPTPSVMPTVTAMATATSTATMIPTSTSTSTHTPTVVSSPTAIQTVLPTATMPNPTVTNSPIATSTSVATSIPTATATQIVEPTSTALATATWTRVPPTSTSISVTPTMSACSVSFSDVPEGSTFHTFVRCLACGGILGGYSDGTFRPNNDVTRGQLSKIVANSADMHEPVHTWTFQDVPPDSTFYEFIERMASRGIIGGYNCGGPGEPCGPESRPYFRPGSNATRGQISKIVSNAAQFGEPAGAQVFEDVPPSNPFYEWIQRLVHRSIMGGYNCGGPGEPCGPESRPYFRWPNNATRGQTSKIVSNTFFPECQAP